jgi:hypothetical protein
MKKIYKEAIALAVAAALCYLYGSFAEATFNLSLWGEGVRGFVAFAIAVSNVVIIWLDPFEGDSTKERRRNIKDMAERAIKAEQIVSDLEVFLEVQSKALDCHPVARITYSELLTKLKEVK